VNLRAAVINHAAEIPAIDLIKEPDRSGVSRSELELWRRRIPEGGLVSQPVERIDLFRGAPDNRLCARSLEAAFVSDLDFFDKRIREIISRRKIGRVRPAQKGSNPLKRNIASLSGDWLNAVQIFGNESIE
jgi:hypothetical protein